MQVWDEVEWLVQLPAEPAEGPVWDPERQVLWWVDIMAGAIHRYDPADGSDTMMDVGQVVGAVGLRRDGGLVAYLADGLVLVDPDTGVVERVADLERDDPSTRANDGKPGPDGWFWGGSMSRVGDRGKGAFYRVSPDGDVQTLLSGVTISNGMDWISEERLYYVDSFAGGLDVLDVDLDAGVVRSRSRVIPFAEEDGLLDGMTLDAQGDIWVAVHGGGAVLRYSPAGQLTGRVDVPTPTPTCPVFGGPDLTHLYITAARSDDAPGGLLRCHVGVAGRAPYRFGGTK